MVTALGSFKDDADVATRLRAIADQDTSYRARAAALQALGKLKAPNSFAILESAINADSPDDILRKAALRSLGTLGDDKAVPLLRTWSALGKPMESRQAAITSLGRMQKDNKDITKELSAYLLEPHFPVRMSALYAIGAREDTPFRNSRTGVALEKQRSQHRDGSDHQIPDRPPEAIHRKKTKRAIGRRR